MEMHFLLSTGEDKLHHLLAWVTGLKNIPPLGFKEKPILRFEHQEDLQGDERLRAGLPTANTCAITLTIPVLTDEDKFNENMKNAIAFRLFSSY